jgi:hypothetical protein
MSHGSEERSRATDAPLCIPGAKTKNPAELATCEHICDLT